MKQTLLILILVVCCSLTFAQSNDFVEASVDVTSPYVGQPVIYTIRVFTTREIENASFVEPRFDGFGRSSFIPETLIGSESRNGVAYTVIEQALLLYPLRTGEQTIEPLRIDIPETPFETATSVQTESLTINIQALPEGAPEAFKNGVGQFDIRAEVDTATVVAGNAITLSVTVNGTGNIEQIIAPDIILPETWRIFPRPPIIDQNTLRFATKTFQWTLLPENVGTVEIPAIAFAFFNPQTQAYETRFTTPVTLTVTEGSTTSQQTIIQQASIEESREPLTLKADSNGFLQPIPPLWFWLLWLIPPFVVLVLWLPRRAITRPRRERAVRRPRSKNALQNAKSQLKTAQSHEPVSAYQQIRTTIYDYVSTKSGVEVTQENIHDKIKHLTPKIQNLLLQCLEEAASGQYAPVSAEDVNGLLRQTLKVLNAVEEVWQ
jgi:hypothetical protein